MPPRVGESIYRFALRGLPGGGCRAWHLEAECLRAAGLLLAWIWVMLPFLLIHNLVAWWRLTFANCVEHYGLLRQCDARTATGKCPRQPLAEPGAAAMPAR